jgi:hypothetical protein
VRSDPYCHLFGTLSKIAISEDCKGACCLISPWQFFEKDTIMRKRGLNSLGKPPAGFSLAKRVDCGGTIRFEAPTKAWEQNPPRSKVLLRVARRQTVEDPRQ